MEKEREIKIKIPNEAYNKLIVIAVNLDMTVDEYCKEIILTTTNNQT